MPTDTTASVRPMPRSVKIEAFGKFILYSISLGDPFIMMAGKLKAEATNILRLICDIFAAILQSLISICRVLSCNADKKLQHNSRAKLILTIFPCLNRNSLGNHYWTFTSFYQHPCNRNENAVTKFKLKY